MPELIANDELERYVDWAERQTLEGLSTSPAEFREHEAKERAVEVLGAIYRVVNSDDALALGLSQIRALTAPYAPYAQKTNEGGAQ